MSVNLISPARALKTRDERKATFSGDECKTAFSFSRQETSVKLLSLEMSVNYFLPLVLSRQEMSVRLLSLEMSAQLLSPSRALKARDERKATFSGDECKTTFFLSRQEMSVKLLVLSLKKVSVKLLSPSQDKR